MGKNYPQGCSRYLVNQGEAGDAGMTRKRRQVYCCEFRSYAQGTVSQKSNHKREGLGLGRFVPDNIRDYMICFCINEAAALSNSKTLHICRSFIQVTETRYRNLNATGNGMLPPAKKLKSHCEFLSGNIAHGKSISQYWTGNMYYLPGVTSSTLWV